MKIKSYSIANNQGDIVDISNYGARLLKWITPVNNKPRNIVLGYDKLEDYLNDPFFIGAIVGPYANRIAHSSCAINGKQLQLNANEGAHHLHGGSNALANSLWQCTEHTDNAITLKCVLADGYNGYPGAMTTEVKYQLTNTSQLTLSINVLSDNTTIAGPTAHPYFNLGQENNVNPHYLQLNSQYYTPTDDAGIPQGVIAQVEGTRFNYLTSQLISEKTVLDNNFLLSLEDSSTHPHLLKHALLQSNDKQLSLQVSSNYPAMQVYTGQHLQCPFRQFQGVCLEPQFCPDSPNQVAFPFHLTSKQQPLTTQITYQLEK